MAGKKHPDDIYGVGTETRARRREVEHLMLNQHSGKDIFDVLGKRYGVVYGTIKNDMTVIRKLWGGYSDDHRQIEEGRARYVASLFELRRRATPDDQQYSVEGEDTDKDAGHIVTIRGKKYRVTKGALKFIHDIDKEIARLSGVELRADTQTIQLSVDAARNYVETVMRIFFKYVTDPEIQQKIVSELDAIDVPDQ